MHNQLTDVIFDGNNLAHRACFVTAPPIIHNGINVVFARQFIRMIMASIRQIPNVGDIYMVWDKRLNKDAVNYRKQLIGSVYKQNRDHSKNDHVFEMIDMLIPILASMGIRNIFPYSLEGDDAMAWLARHHCQRCAIITMDEDLWQLVNDNVSIINPKKGTITPSNFLDFSPVPVDKYVTWKCILGDGSDFVKGLEGYGKKKAPLLAVNMDTATLDPQQLQVLELNRQLLDLEHALTQSPKDIQAFNSQIAFHAKNTTFNRERFSALLFDIGLGELVTDKLITEIQQLTKSKMLMDAFASMGLAQL